VICSVKSAIEQLNNGTLPCPEGLCVVHSASSFASFILFRPDKREQANAFGKEANKEALSTAPLQSPLSAFGVAASTQSPSFVASGMTSGSPVPTCRTVRRDQDASWVGSSSNLKDGESTPKAQVCRWGSASPLQSSPSLANRSPRTLVRGASGTPSRLFTGPASPTKVETSMSVLTTLKSTGQLDVQ